MAEGDQPPFVGMPAQSVPGPKPQPNLWVATLVPLVLVILVLAAGTFAISQALRPRPSSPPAPAVQPYLDFGKSFSEHLLTIGSQTASEDMQRIIDDSTGQFRDETIVERDRIIQSAMDTQVSTTVTAALTALKSIDDHGNSAEVLVAVTQEGRNKAGQTSEPRIWRLALTVEKVDGKLKTSKVDFLK